MFSRKLLAILVGGAGLSVTSLAFGHGSLIDPPSRQAACILEGTQNSGICSEADAKSGGGTFGDWQSFSDNLEGNRDAEDAMANIPGNLICSGKHKGTGFNMASDKWKVSLVKPDAMGKVKMRYGFTAPHDYSFTEFWITKEGFDPTKKAISWGDLQLIGKIDNSHNPSPIAAGKLVNLRAYEDFNVVIPEGRTGRAVIFSRWQRIGQQGTFETEGFYNCSDVNITARGSDIIPPVPVPDPDPIEDPAPTDWYKYANFADHQTPVIGSTVMFRVIGGARGIELVQIRKTITAENLGDKWISELATDINRNHSNLVLVGQQSQSGNIVFNEQQLRGNSIFLNHKSNSAVLSVEAPVNAPIAIVPANFEVVSPSGAAAAYIMDGSNSQNAESYSWKVVGGQGTFWLQEQEGSQWVSTLNKPVVHALIPENTKGTAIYELTVTSKNGVTHSNRVAVTVKDKENHPDPSVKEWETGIDYKADDTVIYEGKKYRCRQAHPSMAHWSPAEVHSLWLPVD